MATTSRATWVERGGRIMRDTDASFGQQWKRHRSNETHRRAGPLTAPSLLVQVNRVGICHRIAVHRDHDSCANGHRIGRKCERSVRARTYVYVDRCCPTGSDPWTDRTIAMSSGDGNALTITITKTARLVLCVTKTSQITVTQAYLHRGPRGSRQRRSRPHTDRPNSISTTLHGRQTNPTAVKGIPLPVFRHRRCYGLALWQLVSRRCSSGRYMTRLGLWYGVCVPATQ